MRKRRLFQHLRITRDELEVKQVQLEWRRFLLVGIGGPVPTGVTLSCFRHCSMKGYSNFPFMCFGEGFPFERGGLSCFGNRDFSLVRRRESSAFSRFGEFSLVRFGKESSFIPRRFALSCLRDFLTRFWRMGCASFRFSNFLLMRFGNGFPFERGGLPFFAFRNFATRLWGAAFPSVGFSRSLDCRVRLPLAAVGFRDVSSVFGGLRFAR